MFWPSGAGLPAESEKKLVLDGRRRGGVELNSENALVVP